MEQRQLHVKRETQNGRVQNGMSTYKCNRKTAELGDDDCNLTAHLCVR